MFLIVSAQIKLISIARFSDKNILQKMNTAITMFCVLCSALMLMLERRVKSEKKKLVRDSFLMICGDRWRRIYELRYTVR